MDESNFLDSSMPDVLRRASVADGELARAVVAELWSFRRGEVPPRMVELPAAEAAGAMIAEAGQDAGEAVRYLLSLGRALRDAASAADLVDAFTIERIAACTDEGASRAAATHARFGHDRREAWLSYLSHELKNPLNTVLNALWLLREQRTSAQAERFLELAERAVRRIEAELQEVRQLHHKVLAAAPSRDAPRPPSADAAPQR